MSDTSHPKIASADHDILDVIRHRWSPRAFDVSADLTDAELGQLFEAARWAPSSANEQPWRFVLTSLSRTPEAYAALLASLTTKNQLWARTAPVLLLVALRLTFERNDSPNTLAWYDAGQAVGFLSLQATAAGLATRQMQGFDVEHARVACAVPPPFEPAVVMAVGRVGDPDGLEVDTHRTAERQPRQRRPIAEFVFSGTWGAAFTGSGGPAS
jgi:nitroreductase